MEINRIGVGKQHIGCLRPVATATPLQSSFFLTEIINFWVPGYPCDHFLEDFFSLVFLHWYTLCLGKTFFPVLLHRKQLEEAVFPQQCFVV